MSEPQSKVPKDVVSPEKSGDAETMKMKMKMCPKGPNCMHRFMEGDRWKCKYSHAKVEVERWKERDRLFKVGNTSKQLVPVTAYRI